MLKSAWRPSFVRPRPGQSGIALLAAAVGALLLLPVPKALETPVTSRLMDLGHVPLFAAITLVAHKMLPDRLRIGSRLLAGWAVSVCVAMSAEILQSFIPSREASLEDLTLGVAGASLACAGLLCRGKATVWRVCYALTLAVVGVAMALSVLKAWRIAAGFARQMPVLATFEQPWDVERWHAKPGTRMQRRTIPGAQGWWLEVQASAAEYPGVSVEDFEPNWNGYAALALDVLLPMPEPLDLTVRIDDDKSSRNKEPFVTIVHIESDRRRYRIELPQAIVGGSPSALDRRLVTEVHFFLDRPGESRTFFIDNVRLERLRDAVGTRRRYQALPPPFDETAAE